MQKLQNKCTRLVCLKPKFKHVSPLLNQLHWLPVGERIMYKTLLYVYKSVEGLSPQYIQDCLLKGMLRVLWEHALLAAPILLFLSRRNVLGIDLSPWLFHGWETFYLWESRMPLVNSHSNQCSRIIFFLDCLPLFSAFLLYVVIIFMSLRFVTAGKGAI